MHLLLCLAVDLMHAAAHPEFLNCSEFPSSFGRRPGLK